MISPDSEHTAVPVLVFQKPEMYLAILCQTQKSPPFTGDYNTKGEKMNYPKQIMNRKELIEQMGFPEAFLMRAFSTPGQTFAWRQNPANKTSPILFDTEGFEKWRVDDCKMQERARKMRGVVA